MKYSKFTYPFLAIALALGTAACSRAEEDAEPELKVDPEGMKLQFLVSMPGGNGSRAYSTDPGILAEQLIDTDRLFIASYDEDGNLISQIYPAPEAASEDEIPEVQCELYPNLTWGPTIAAYFNKEAKEKHQNGFRLVAYFVPKGHYRIDDDFPFLFHNPTDPTRYTLNMPQYAASTLWTPSEKLEEGRQIPMAGNVKVTKEYMDNFDPKVHRFSPFMLPDIPMTRAMSKIVVEDPDNFIAEAQFSTSPNGYLLPAKSMWWDEGAKALAAPRINERHWVKGEKKDGKFTFYSYEMAFPTQDAEHSAREIVKMKAVDGAVPNKPESSIYFSPYDEEGNMMADLSEQELQTYGDGVWSGILRNHVYVYTVMKPQNGDLEIYVKTAVWEPEKESFEF